MSSLGPWHVDEQAYRRWSEDRGPSSGDALLLDRPSVKNAIYLALLENNGRYLSYTDLNEIFRRRGLFRSSGRGQRSGANIPVPTLRVALSELNRSLHKKEHYLEVRSRRVGKLAQFALTDRHGYAEKQHGLLHGLSEPLIEPRDITRGLVRDGGALPFASLYASYRAASQWLCFSSVQTSEKRFYEANAFDAYRIDKILQLRSYGGEMGYVSLGTGEGLGEVALLNRLLRDHNRPRPRRLYYVAIDTSEFLLTSHSHLVRERFSAELAEGTLVYTPLVGDLFQLQRCMAQIRCKHGKDLLKDIPILCSYFGNCLGNYEGHEWDFFRSVTEAFPVGRLSILVGVSLMRRTSDASQASPVEENYTLDEFLLETPRHLMYDLELLRSEDEHGNPISVEANKEFLPESVVKDLIPSAPYDTATGIQGRVYRFYYTLQNHLITWDRKQRLRKGNRILLYSIIKYDLPTLVNFLEGRGFSVKAPPKQYEVQRITEGDEEFRYAVLAVSREE